MAQAPAAVEKRGAKMGAIFKPKPLTVEDIGGGCGETTMEEIRAFIEAQCYTDEPVVYCYDDDLPSELVLFAESWEKLEGYPESDFYGFSGKKSDAFKTMAVLSLINGAFFGDWEREKITEKLGKSSTKLDLIETMTHVASAYCWYIALKARIEIAEIRKKWETG